ncbi:hypothetical protein MEN41_18840 [Dolichospermum sp. ST_con]|nr:hypothetical protein [Dolichospermum sp. ST_con]MDD1419742.1 hypothetical protein [Dolichospermum sp. ST_sed1]MDD1425236.1 hypothetical protein [Dolichospermum sp. ST_sed9]MDD1464956.1 hypothetical protein [Dolichospermum sp. ST_sed5]
MPNLDLEKIIIPYPLTLTSDTLAINAVTLMSQLDNICHLTKYSGSDTHLQNVEKSGCILVIDQEQLGLIGAHQASQPRFWQSLEVELLENLSIQLAIAIQQSQLYQQVQKELKERIAFSYL